MEDTSTPRTDFAAIAEECEQDFTRKLEATEESFLRDARFNFLCNADGETPFRTNRNEKGLYDLILDTKNEENPVLARNLSPASVFACMAVAAFFIESEKNEAKPAAAEPEKTEDGRTLAQVLDELREAKEERDELKKTIAETTGKVKSILDHLDEAKSRAEDASSDAETARDEADAAVNAADEGRDEASNLLEELRALSF